MNNLGTEQQFFGRKRTDRKERSFQKIVALYLRYSVWTNSPKSSCCWLSQGICHVLYNAKHYQGITSIFRILLIIYRLALQWILTGYRWLTKLKGPNHACLDLARLGFASSQGYVPLRLDPFCTIPRIGPPSYLRTTFGVTRSLNSWAIKSDG